MSKMIVINSQGPIFPKGGIIGPIETPYKEDLATIAILLMNNYDVEEVVKDRKVKLNLSNYKDNHEMQVAESIPAEDFNPNGVSIGEGEPQTDENSSPVPPAPEDKKEEKEVAPVDEPKKEVQQQQQHQSKKNKHKQQRQFQADQLESK